MASADNRASDSDENPDANDARRGRAIGLLNDAVVAAQAMMAKVAPADRTLSDEFIAERRAEAARE